MVKGNFPNLTIPLLIFLHLDSGGIENEWDGWVEVGLEERLIWPQAKTFVQPPLEIRDLKEEREQCVTMCVRPLVFRIR